MRRGIIILIMSLFSSLLYSQRICEKTRELVRLSGNTTVYLYQEVSNKQGFYYVPAEVQLLKKNGKPAYSFLEYGKGTPTGAILHCMLSWGLDKKQLNELKRYVQKKHGEQAKLLGGVHLESVNNDLIISTSKPLGAILKKSLKSKGSLPTMPSSKMAVSFRMNASDAKLVKQAIKNPSKFRGVQFRMKYHLITYNCRSGIKAAKKSSIQIEGKLTKWF